MARWRVAITREISNEEDRELWGLSDCWLDGWRSKELIELLKEDIVSVLEGSTWKISRIQEKRNG